MGRSKNLQSEVRVATEGFMSQPCVLRHFLEFLACCDGGLRIGWGYQIMEPTCIFLRCVFRRGGLVSIRFLALLAFLAGLATLRAQPDYANAHWDPPNCVKYYTSGNGHHFCVIHDMEGYYEASITLLNTCGTGAEPASVYYLVEGLTDSNDPAPLGTNISPFTFTDTNAVNPLEFYRALYSP